MDILRSRINMPAPQAPLEIYERQGLCPEEQSSVLEQVPGGIIRAVLDAEAPSCTVEYISEGFMALTGYARQETIEWIRQGQPVFLPDDLPLLWDSLIAQAASSGSITGECRMVRKDQSVLWVLLQGNVIARSGSAYTVVFLLTDVTAMKQVQCRLESERERYRVVAEISDDYLFEYDVAADTMTYSEKYASCFAILDSKELFNAYAASELKLQDEDSRIIRNIYDNLRKGQPYYSAKFRAKGADGNIRWYSICFTTVFDPEGKPLRSVGKITDIDEMKKETDKLMEKAQRDSLTKLTNKMTTKKLITQFLKEDSDSVHALLMIDIDNFKSINDTLGHLTGDMVLVEIASKFKSLFRSTDVVGRIGGDEFLIMLRGIQSDVRAEEKAEAICDICRGLEFEHRQVTGSVGIAMYPADGTDFDTLYHKADVALYEAKKWGKNTYFKYCDYGEQQMLF